METHGGRKGRSWEPMGLPYRRSSASRRSRVGRNWLLLVRKKGVQGRGWTQQEVLTSNVQGPRSRRLHWSSAGVSPTWGRVWLGLICFGQSLGPPIWGSCTLAVWLLPPCRHPSIPNQQYPPSPSPAPSLWTEAREGPHSYGLQGLDWAHPANPAPKVQNLSDIHEVSSLREVPCFHSQVPGVRTKTFKEASLLARER